MKKLVAALALFLLPVAAWAQWDATKPATSTALVSADIRNNWTALSQTVGTTNLLADPTFLIWPAGTPPHRRTTCWAAPARR